MWADEQVLNFSFPIKQYIFNQGLTFNECPHERKAFHVSSDLCETSNTTKNLQ
jgi:hypothetical protein